APRSPPDRTTARTVPATPARIMRVSLCSSSGGLLAGLGHELQRHHVQTVTLGIADDEALRLHPVPLVLVYRSVDPEQLERGVPTDRRQLLQLLGRRRVGRLGARRLRRFGERPVAGGAIEAADDLN